MIAAQPVRPTTAIASSRASQLGNVGIERCNRNGNDHRQDQQRQPRQSAQLRDDWKRR